VCVYIEEQRCGGYASCLNGVRRSRSICALLLYSSTPLPLIKKKSPIQSKFTIDFCYDQNFIRFAIFVTIENVQCGFAGSQMPPTSAKYPPPPTTTSSCYIKTIVLLLTTKKKTSAPQRDESLRMCLCVCVSRYFSFTCPPPQNVGIKGGQTLTHIFLFLFFYSFQYSTN
jgi:hypothetical protein